MAKTAKKAKAKKAAKTKKAVKAKKAIKAKVAKKKTAKKSTKKKIQKNVLGKMLDPKLAAVNRSIDEEMDASEGRGRWNEDGRMDTDYDFDDHSIRSFLGGVGERLDDRGYALDQADNAFITACVSSKVYRVRLRVYDKTTTK